MFQFTHPAWGATGGVAVDFSLLSFQFTHPAWGATHGHIPRQGAAVGFQFTHPAWGATRHSRRVTLRRLFQFTHPAWGATRKIHRHTMTRIVSIHAPRVGCDAIKGVFSCVSVDVSIHAPRVGCDIHNPAILRFSCEFQFTHPAWGATA